MAAKTLYNYYHDYVYINIKSMKTLYLDSCLNVYIPGSLFNRKQKPVNL